ncbi:hypothetical protein ECDEC9A_1411 [Escherichia coli DEC9A]|nr:hypothetical protein ECDEC9A_1411 [Escherichia coli DEC9A]
MVGILQLARSGVMVMSEQYLITLDEWNLSGYSLPIQTLPW